MKNSQETPIPQNIKQSLINDINRWSEDEAV